MAETRASIVVPLYNEARSLAELTERLSKVLDAAKLDWEVVFVDDGSSDDSFAEIEKLHGADPRYKCVRFARNFGSHVAISAGLEHAHGDIAIVITADLEEPPEAIPDFLAKWREGHHLVWGIRAKRANRGLGALGSRLYHRIFAWLADYGPGQAEIGGGYFLADRRVLDAVRSFRERNRSIIGLLLWAGFAQTRITYEPANRKHGASKWSLAKKLRLALDTFVGFSNRPLRLMLQCGLASGAIAIAALIYVLVEACVHDGALSRIGFTVAAIGALALLVGVQLFSMGLVGEYLWRALDEARGRPLYTVMDRLGLEAPRG